MVGPSPRPAKAAAFVGFALARTSWITYSCFLAEKRNIMENNLHYTIFLQRNRFQKSRIEQMAKHKVYMVVPKKIKEENEAYSGVYSVLSFEEFFEHHLDPAIGRWQLS